ncbi:hypothetical protein Plav_3304 [Parvibaculum lavamentivorans DS-1]|uniref:Glycosyltransferase RgtA/B/C/D-like domain-containing protein n=1 Tax=Parvibaculum lavamentivorans (strain DS-1 / DSM 13023 / NCIMB 13966) TaxID=402881 RepID=A7HYC6_PARL1|nr:hypothetical protein [Parvibaculum lavamentivorans]ABS64909.1 hypothetical protein Plav_3304 [Parvibaculum lavamentivorans DS-1]
MAYQNSGTHLRQHSNLGRYALILLLVVLIPNAVLLSGVFQLFPPIGWVDPGIYTGYFWDLNQRIERYGANYFSMRLPFTVVGFLVHSIFAPEVAAKVFAVLFNSLAAISLCLLVAGRAGIVAGVAAAWTLTLNPVWVATISRTYVDGPAIAYTLTALAVLFTPRTGRQRVVALVAGGGVAAAAVYTHPITVLLFGCAIAADIFLNRPKLASLLKEGAWILTGVAAATAILGLVSVSFGGNFLFVLADPYAFERTFSGFGANYQYALSSWVPNAYRLLPVPVLLAFGISLLVFLKRTHPSFWLAAIGVAMSGGMAMFLLVLDFIIGGATLQSSFYSSYLVAGLAIIAGAAAGLAFDHANPRLRYLTLSGIAAAAITIAVFSYAELAWAMVDMHRGFIWIALFGASILACSLLFCSPRIMEGSSRHSIAPRSGFVLLASVIVLCGFFNTDTRRIFVIPSGLDYVTSYRSTIAVSGFVDRLISNNERLFFWYDRDELTLADRPLGAYGVYELRFSDKRFFLNYWDSLTAVWLWDRSSLGWTMPELKPAELERLQQHSIPAMIFTLCLDAAKCYKSAATLTSHGYRVTEVDRLLVGDTGYTPFWVVAFRAEPAGDGEM